MNGEQPDDESEGDPSLSEVVGAARLMEQDEAEYHERQGGGDEDARPVPLDLLREVGEPIGAGALGADHEDLNRDVASDPRHRKEDVERQEPLVGVAADDGEEHRRGTLSGVPLSHHLGVAAAHLRPDSPLSSSSGGSKPTSTTSNPLCRSLSAYPV